MSINFGQFPTPRLPLQSGDIVVGYQLVNSVPTLAQYTMLQLFGGIFPGGTVPVSQGGTGRTTLTVNSVLIGEGTNPVNFAAPGALGTMLLSNGPGVDPSFGSNPALNGATITNTTVTSSVTGVTGTRVDNSTQLATDNFVNQQIASSTANVPFPLVGGVYNQASLGTGTSFVIFVSGGTISSVVSVIGGGTGYAVGDLLLVIGGNYDAILRVTNVVGGVIQSGGLAVIYGGTGYTTGATTSAVPVPPGQRTVTFTGVLTSNVTFIIQNGTFLTAARRIQFNNNTTGAFTVTVKLSNGAGGSVGTGVVLAQGTNNSSATLVETDGMNDVWLADTPLGIGALPVNSPAVGSLINVQQFTATGTYTPTAGTKSILIYMVGAGGAGGGAAATGAAQGSTAGGGGSGAFAVSRITSPTSQTVTIGTGGTGVSGAAGNAGTVTSFGATITCPAGGGGATVPATAQATGASTTGGTGGAIATGATLVNAGGNPGTTASMALLGFCPSVGAPSQFGGGGVIGFQTTGGAGIGFGSGGGGCANSASQAARTGGAGAGGLCLIFEYA